MVSFFFFFFFKLVGKWIAAKYETHFEILLDFKRLTKPFFVVLQIFLSSTS